MHRRRPRVNFLFSLFRVRPAVSTTHRHKPNVGLRNSTTSLGMSFKPRPVNAQSREAWRLIPRGASSLRVLPIKTSSVQASSVVAIPPTGKPSTLTNHRKALPPNLWASLPIHKADGSSPGGHPTLIPQGHTDSSYAEAPRVPHRETLAHGTMDSDFGTTPAPSRALLKGHPHSLILTADSSSEELHWNKTDHADWFSASRRLISQTGSWVHLRPEHLLAAMGTTRPRSETHPKI